jgi:transcriptional regulator with XRE-family HTH domain
MAYFKDGLTSYVRKSLGLTQVDLALILKVNPVTVSKWERGSTPEEPKDREKTYLEYFKRAIE